MSTSISDYQDRISTLRRLALNARDLLLLAMGEERGSHSTGLPEKEQLCIACSRCCREIGIYTHPGLYTCSEEEIVKFYQTRGFTVEKSDEVLILTLKHSCPHLTPKGCDIYKQRPRVCRDYSGLDDFGESCLWSALPECKKTRGKKVP